MTGVASAPIPSHLRLFHQCFLVMHQSVLPNQRTVPFRTPLLESPEQEKLFGLQSFKTSLWLLIVALEASSDMCEGEEVEFPLPRTSASAILVSCMSHLLFAFRMLTRKVGIIRSRSVEESPQGWWHSRHLSHVICRKDSQFCFLSSVRKSQSAAPRMGVLHNR